MKSLMRATLVAAVLAALTLGFAKAAGADEQPSSHASPENVVFVQTDNTSANQVVAYDRAGNGTLTPNRSYETDGLGGVLNGSAVDHLASQGSLTFDRYNNLLYAVNAGSDTVSVFSVRGDKLALRQTVSSGGVFPASVTVQGNVVFVLNALNGGSVQGYFSAFGHLIPLPWAHRNLGLTIPSDATQFTHTPGQVAFSPDGSKLIVTTKANGNNIDIFRVGPFGTLSPSPVINSEPGTVPFGVSFDSAGHLVVAESSSSTPALATFSLHADGTVALIDQVGTGEPATCWVAPAKGFFYASDAGGPAVSRYQAADGQLTLLGNTSTDPGTVDASSSNGGDFLYVQTGANGIVDEFRVNNDGSLTQIGSVIVPGAAGGEGIVAF
jgi:6-phosphogluconolactonase (cycloisomerase 2 family)